MRRFTGALLSILLIFSVGTMTVLANPGEEALPDSTDGGEEAALTEADSSSLSGEVLPEEDTASPGDAEPATEIGPDAEPALEGEQSEEVVTLSAEAAVVEHTASLSLLYDDRQDVSELSGLEMPSDGEYVIYQTEDENILSHPVSGGSTDENVFDEALLTQQEEGSPCVTATAVGSGTVWFVRADQEEALRNILEEEADGSNTENSDSGEPEETINVYEVELTVDPAPLTLMFLTGQSNMEGLCSDSPGYQPGASIACEDGSVYSTFAPSSSGLASSITGGKTTSACTEENAADFVAGSLQGAAAPDGTLAEPLNMSGNTLPYAVNSLTSAGGGKTGADSGLAYEWHQLTGDKVWVINTAYSATDINSWIPGGSRYQRSLAVWDYVLQTYNAELTAGHYKEAEKMVFWQQGETGDRTLRAADYESYFSTMYSAMCRDLGQSNIPFGIIMVRAGESPHNTETDLKMTGPRIAQYWLGGSDSSYPNVFVVSNANEQWVSNSGVSTYFNKAYPSGTLAYPTQDGAAYTVPSKVGDVHGDIHYSQIGHNENGLTAAYGMYAARNNKEVPSGVSWKNEAGQDITSLSLYIEGDTSIAVPEVNPVYTAKRVSYKAGENFSYEAATGTVTAQAKAGTSALTAAYGGKTLTATLSVTVTQSADLSGLAGKNYTGIYHAVSTDTWWYLKNGVIQRDFEGVEENEYGWWYIKNGKVDFSYTGFAENRYGWWYIENGQVIFSTNSVLQDSNKKIDETGGWWYVTGGQVQTSYTGVANYSNANGWWYVKNGKVDFSANTVAQNDYGWWYVEGGKVVFSYTGFAQNQYGWWYIEGGKVIFATNSVLEDRNKKIDGTDGWWYVTGGQVQTSFTGVANHSNDYGWWYVKKGKVDFSANTVAQNNYGWWYVTGGQVQFGFTGVGNYGNDYGWWYIRDGKVDFSVNTVAQNNYGWWYVTGGKVQFGYTGVANYSNTYGWWYINSGKVDFSVNTVAENQYGWWYVKDGKVDFSYTGVADNPYGTWYIKKGEVDFSFSGNVTVSGDTYSVTNGKVTR